MTDEEITEFRVKLDKLIIKAEFVHKALREMNSYSELDEARYTALEVVSGLKELI